jgi:hypothetical protein
MVIWFFIFSSINVGVYIFGQNICLIEQNLDEGNSLGTQIVHDVLRCDGNQTFVKIFANRTNTNEYFTEKFIKNRIDNTYEMISQTIKLLNITTKLEYILSMNRNFKMLMMSLNYDLEGDMGVLKSETLFLKNESRIFEKYYFNITDFDDAINKVNNITIDMSVYSNNQIIQMSYFFDRDNISSLNSNEFPFKNITNLNVYKSLVKFHKETMNYYPRYSEIKTVQKNILNLIIDILEKIEFINPKLRTNELSRFDVLKEIDLNNNNLIFILNQIKTLPDYSKQIYEIIISIINSIFSILNDDLMKCNWISKKLSNVKMFACGFMMYVFF